MSNHLTAADPAKKRLQTLINTWCWMMTFRANHAEIKQRAKTNLKQVIGVDDDNVLMCTLFASPDLSEDNHDRLSNELTERFGSLSNANSFYLERQNAHIH